MTVAAGRPHPDADTPTTVPQALAALGRHGPPRFPRPTPGTRCRACRRPWPCAAARAAYPIIGRWEVPPGWTTPQ